MRQAQMRHRKLQDAHAQEGAGKAEDPGQHALGLGHRLVAHHQQIDQQQIEHAVASRAANCTQMNRLAAASDRRQVMRQLGRSCSAP